MPNEDLLKLITMLDTLGYRVVSVAPEKKQHGNGDTEETGRTELIIYPKK
jgi:hypothetical protein